MSAESKRERESSKSQKREEKEKREREERVPIRFSSDIKIIFLELRKELKPPFQEAVVIIC